MAGPKFKFTSEQQAIVDLAVPQPQVPEVGRIIRVTSAAGTGKTTTLEGLARRFSEMGHSNITYLTFNRTAAGDASTRLGAGVACRTFHSQALKCLNLAEFSPADEGEVERIIARQFSVRIDKFLGPMKNETKCEISKKQRIRKMVVFYIRKTFERFLNSDDNITEGFDHLKSHKTYYPAQKFHENEGAELGLGKWIPNIYCHCAKELFTYLRPDPDRANKISTFDVIMKECQLQKLMIDCTVLLVDESQDCNACQISWAQAHRTRRTVAFVGDAVQTIYSFRGAKSEFLRNMKGCIEDHKLTTSFRFGPVIGSVANTILFWKHNSTQDNWEPYRLVGGNSNPGTLHTTEELEFPMTVLACSNMSLLIRGLELLMIDLPDGPIKISLNGKSENSGRGKWKQTFKLIDLCLKLFLGESKHLKSLADFADEDELTWEAFSQAVCERELKKYALIVALVSKYEENTPAIVEKFQVDIINANHSADDADVILSTIHAAKGMEWDRVEIIDDLLPMYMYIIGHVYEKGDEGQGANVYQSARQREVENRVPMRGRFAVKNWGDDLHLWYVAVTRARKQLRLPHTFVQFMESVHDIAVNAKRTDLPKDYSQDVQEIFLRPFQSEEDAARWCMPDRQHMSQLFTLREVRTLHDTLVVPWVAEVQGTCNKKQQKALFKIGEVQQAEDICDEVDVKSEGSVAVKHEDDNDDDDEEDDGNAGVFLKVKLAMKEEEVLRNPYVAKVESCLGVKRKNDTVGTAHARKLIKQEWP